VSGLGCVLSIQQGGSTVPGGCVAVGLRLLAESGCLDLVDPHGQRLLDGGRVIVGLGRPLVGEAGTGVRQAGAAHRLLRATLGLADVVVGRGRTLHQALATFDQLPDSLRSGVGGLSSRVLHSLEFILGPGRRDV
jgi:hypothetical protein